MVGLAGGLSIFPGPVWRAQVRLGSGWRGISVLTGSRVFRSRVLASYQGITYITIQRCGFPASHMGVWSFCFAVMHCCCHHVLLRCTLLLQCRTVCCQHGSNNAVSAMLMLYCLVALLRCALLLQYRTASLHSVAATSGCCVAIIRCCCNSECRTA